MKGIIFQLLALFGAGTIGFLIARPIAPKFVKVLDRLAEHIKTKRDKAKNSIYEANKGNKLSNFGSNHAAKNEVTSKQENNNKPLNKDTLNIVSNPNRKGVIVSSHDEIVLPFQNLEQHKARRTKILNLKEFVN